MLFNSWGYLLFLAAAVPLHWLLPRRYRLGMLFLFSLLFYAMWRWQFCFLMLFSAAVDYTAALRIARTEDGRIRKRWLITSLVTNLGLLVFFKYTYFIHDGIRSAASLAGGSIPPLGISIILPLGISFYTFQTISYTIDVYRGTALPEKNPLAFFTYVTFWPQLVAGPILRAAEVIPLLKADRKARGNDILKGLERIVTGLFKKAVLADTIAPVVDKAFAADPAALTALDTWTALILFGFQIYFDFAGYSDIAIGSARLVGITLPENFAFPYLARSPREFWKRWHISLSSWIRDYLYLPLTGRPFKTVSTGGLGEAATDRHGMRSHLALFATWLIMGLWHGAGWTFALWGLYHAVFIFLYRQVPWLDRISSGIPAAGWVLMAGITTAGWLPFRSQSVSQTMALAGTLVNPAAYLRGFEVIHSFWAVGCLLLWLGMITSWKMSSADGLAEKAVLLPVRIMYYAIMTFSILVCLKTTSQFIYFQF